VTRKKVVNYNRGQAESEESDPDDPDEVDYNPEKVKKLCLSHYLKKQSFEEVD
jgi:hypothetical protein